MVLSRRMDERIIISEQIEVKVLQIRGNSVKLGITCDESIPIRRHEIPAPTHAAVGSCSEPKNTNFVGPLLPNLS